MGKKTDIQLPKSVKKSDKKVQEKYIKAYKKSMDKHNDEERARKKAISKLQKKYEKVDKRWVRKDEASSIKAEKKAEKPTRKTEKKVEKKSEKKSDKKSKKKDDEKAPLKDSKKSDKKKAEKQKAEKPTKKDKKSVSKDGKKSGKSKDSKKKPKKSKSDDLLLDILSDKDFDPDEMIEILEERVEDGENLTVEEASEEVGAMEDELLGVEDALEEAQEPEITEVGEYEGANPEEAEDPIAAQEAFEDALTEPNLAEALDEEPSAVVQPEQAQPQSLTAGRLISDVTRAELYKEAQALKIPGRASMNKEQLFAAIELAQ